MWFLKFKTWIILMNFGIPRIQAIPIIRLFNYTATFADHKEKHVDIWCSLAESEDEIYSTGLTDISV